MGKGGNGLCVLWLREHVNFDGPDCLIWPFSRQPTGYGAFGYLGKVHYAHRFMCELVNGPPPEQDYESAHSCGRGNQGCVHPKHLSWKTISQNSLDCRAHGTQARNMRGNAGRVSDAQASEIRSLKGTKTQAEIAAMFGVSQPTIRDIFTGRSHNGTRRIKRPFTADEVHQIRAIGYTKTLREIAELFNVNMPAIHQVRIGKTYRNIPDVQSAHSPK